MTTITIIALICSVILCISFFTKALSFRRKYHIALYEWNMGRGYARTVKEYRQRYYDNSAMTVIFLISTAILMTHALYFLK